MLQMTSNDIKFKKKELFAVESHTASIDNELKSN